MHGRTHQGNTRIHTGTIALRNLNASQMVHCHKIQFTSSLVRAFLFVARPHQSPAPSGGVLVAVDAHRLLPVLRENVVGARGRVLLVLRDVLTHLPVPVRHVYLQGTKWPKVGPGVQGPLRRFTNHWSSILIFLTCNFTCFMSWIFSSRMMLEHEMLGRLCTRSQL